MNKTRKVFKYLDIYLYFVHVHNLEVLVLHSENDNYCVYTN